MRWGSGEATITEVELINAHGERTSRFRTGEQFTVRMDYDFKRRIDKPVFGLAITTLEGVVPLGVATAGTASLCPTPWRARAVST